MRDVRDEEQCYGRSHYRRGGAGDGRQLPEQDCFDEADERGLEAVAEVHVPVTAHRTAEVEAVRLRSEEHTSELQSRLHLVCRLLLEKKKKKKSKKDKS